jgi:hypothetical protein
MLVSIVIGWWIINEFGNMSYKGRNIWNLFDWKILNISLYNRQWQAKIDFSFFCNYNKVTLLYVWSCDHKKMFYTLDVACSHQHVETQPVRFCVWGFDTVLRKTIPHHLPTSKCENMELENMEAIEPGEEQVGLTWLCKNWSKIEIPNWKSF